MPNAHKNNGNNKGAVQREAQVRHALEAAVKKLGDPTVAAYKAKVSGQTIWNWLRVGRLDRVQTAEALRFARAAGVPLEKLVVDAAPRER